MFLYGCSSYSHLGCESIHVGEDQACRWFFWVRAEIKTSAALSHLPLTFIMCIFWNNDGCTQHCWKGLIKYSGFERSITHCVNLEKAEAWQMLNQFRDPVCRLYIQQWWQEVVFPSSQTQYCNFFSQRCAFGNFAAGDNEASSKWLLSLFRAHRFCGFFKGLGYRPQHGVVNELIDSNSYWTEFEKQNKEELVCDSCSTILSKFLTASGDPRSLQN